MLGSALHKRYYMYTCMYLRRLDTIFRSHVTTYEGGAQYTAYAHIWFPYGDIYINIDVGRVCSLTPLEPPRLAHHSKALTELIPDI